MNIRFNKKVIKNGFEFNVNYEGNVDERRVNISELNFKMDNFMNNNKQPKNLLKCVKFIRTILKEVNEKFLVATYSDNNLFQTVTYNNSYMTAYEKIENHSVDNYNLKFLIKYSADSGLKFRVIDSKEDAIEHDNLRAIPEEISRSIKEIYNLKNARTMKINKDSEILIEIYKLFYSKTPDFSKQNINLEIQAMMCILSKFGVSLDEEYYFRYYDKNIPTSINLENVVNDLFPFGEAQSLDNQIKLAEDVKKTIEVVGKNIREYIGDKLSDRDSKLIKICNNIYLDSDFYENNNSLESFDYNEDNNISKRLIKNINAKLNN